MFLLWEEKGIISFQRITDKFSLFSQNYNDFHLHIGNLKIITVQEGKPLVLLTKSQRPDLTAALLPRSLSHIRVNRGHKRWPTLLSL